MTEDQIDHLFIMVDEACAGNAAADIVHLQVSAQILECLLRIEKHIVRSTDSPLLVEVA